jgi:hypothetical protein
MQNTIDNDLMNLTVSPTARIDMSPRLGLDPLWAHKAAVNHMTSLRDQIIDPTVKAELTGHINNIWHNINSWRFYDPSTWGGATGAILHAGGWLAEKTGEAFSINLSDIGAVVGQVTQFFSNGIEWHRMVE